MKPRYYIRQRNGYEIIDRKTHLRTLGQFDRGDVAQERVTQLNRTIAVLKLFNSQRSIA